MQIEIAYNAIDDYIILMDKTTIRMDLEGFAKGYFSLAGQLIGESCEMDSFYENIRTKLGIEKELFLTIHHPFHWVMFCNANSGFEIAHNGSVERPKTFVKKTRESDVNYLVAELMKYREMLEARLAA